MVNYKVDSKLSKEPSSFFIKYYFVDAELSGYGMIYKS
jgi:hypothetical protein